MIGSLFILGLAALGGPEVSQTGSCPDVDLQARLAELLEASDADGHGWRIGADLRADGSIALRIADPSGELSTRTLSSPDCAVAIDAAAFIVASAIDPTIEPGGERKPEAAPVEEAEPSVVVPEPEPEPELATEPEPESEPEPERDLERDRPAAPPNRLPRPAIWLGLGPGIMGGSLPGPVGRLMVFADAEGPQWRIRLDGAATLRAEARAEQVSRVGAQLGQWSIGARGCGVLRRGRIDASGCGGVEAGQLYASGFGFDAATSTRLPWGAVLGAAGVGVGLGARLRLWADAELGFVLNQAEIVVDNLERIHRLGPLFGRGTLGLAVRI